VPDLTSELQQMADHAARTTRPLAAADIIARGSRRRARSAAQKSMAVLSAAGVTAAIILTGAASSPPAPAAAGTLPGGNTLTETTSSPAGTMTVQVRYHYEPGGKIRVVSVTCSGHAVVVVPKPALLVVIGPPNLPGSPPAASNRTQWQNVSLRTYVFSISLRLGTGGEFTGSLSARDISIIRHHGGLPGNETLAVTLASRSGRSATVAKQVSIRPIMQDDLVLTRSPR
jgi:hypothetical protein